MSNGKRLVDYLNRADSQRLRRFVVVGVALNLSAYGIFLALLVSGVAPMTAMTIGYVGALALSFVANRAWTFQHHEHWRRSIWKYAVLYFCIYVAQALLLNWAVHARVNLTVFQFFVVCAMATVSFLLQRLWVFAPANRD